jgi:hypothetical protein
MSAPGYSIIRPTRGVSTVDDISDDSKLLPIGDRKYIEQTVMRVFPDVHWAEEVRDMSMNVVGLIKNGENQVRICFEAERMYIGEINPKWLSVDPAAPFDVAEEAKRLAEAFGCVVLSWDAVSFLP